jgi:hypothetical protein
MQLMHLPNCNNDVAGNSRWIVNGSEPTDIRKVTLEPVS